MGVRDYAGGIYPRVAEGKGFTWMINLRMGLEKTLGRFVKNMDQVVESQTRMSTKLSKYRPSLVGLTQGDYSHTSNKYEAWRNKFMSEKFKHFTQASQKSFSSYRINEGMPYADYVKSRLPVEPKNIYEKLAMLKGQGKGFLGKEFFKTASAFGASGAAAGGSGAGALMAGLGGAMATPLGAVIAIAAGVLVIAVILKKILTGIMKIVKSSESYGAFSDLTGGFGQAMVDTILMPLLISLNSLIGSGGALTETMAILQPLFDALSVTVTAWGTQLASYFGEGGVVSQAFNMLLQTFILMSPAVALIIDQFFILMDALSPIVEYMVKIGTLMAPILLFFYTIFMVINNFFLTFMSGFVQGFMTPLLRVLDALQAAFAPIVKIVVEDLLPLVMSFYNTFKPVIEAIGKIIGIIFGVALLPIILALIAPILLIVGGFVAMVAVVKVLIEVFKLVVGSIKDAGDKVRTFFEDVNKFIDGLKNPIKSGGDILGSIF